MDDSRGKKLGLGGLVLVSAVMLGGMTVFFGGTPTVFSTRKPYTLIFAEAPGVMVGTPVRRSGVVIGEVTSVDLDDATSKVRVGIVLGDKYAIKTNETPVVNQDIFSRNTTIDFVLVKGGDGPAITAPTPTDPPKLEEPKLIEPNVKEGAIKPVGFFPDGRAFAQIPDGKQPPAKAPPVPVPPGSVIEGRPSDDARVLVDDARVTLKAANEALKTMQRTFEAMTTDLGPALRAGADEFTGLGKSLRETVPEIRRTNDEIRSLVGSVRAAAPDFKRTNDELQAAIRTYAGIGETIANIVNTNRKPLEDMIPKVNAILDDTRSIAAKANKSSDDVVALIQRMANVISDENVRNATATLRALQSASAQFDGVLKDAGELMKEATKTAKKLQGSLVTADGALANINAATKPLADRSERILRNLDNGFDQLNRLLVQAGEVLAPLGRGEGTLAKLFNDPSIYNNLNDAICLSTRLLPRLDRVLKDFEVFADKLARHPELIGVGGAISPSGGLKDSVPAQPTMHRRP